MSLDDTLTAAIAAFVGHHPDECELCCEADDGVDTSPFEELVYLGVLVLEMF